MKETPKVRCPTCKRVGAWFEDKHGPFCSRRCKLLDLGKWFQEENRISEPLRAEHLDKYAGMSGGNELDKPDDQHQIQ